MARFALLSLAVGLAVLCGCESSARREVRGLVDQERGRVLSAQARINDSVVHEYLQSVAKPILVAARRVDGADRARFRPNKTLDVYDRFEVYAMQDAVPNAWVLGDDFACISTSALLLAESPDEVAFVLAHEYSHLRRHHAVQSVMRRYTTEFGAALATGLMAMSAGLSRANNPYYTQDQYDRDMRNARLVGQAILASYTPHRLEDEHEADAGAIELLVAAGYPIARAADFLERMIPLYGDSVGSRTHPPTSQRIARIKRAIAERSRYEPWQRLDAERFRQMQDRVRMVTLQAAETRTLIMYSVERWELGRGASLPPVQACGPLDADMDRIIAKYTQLLTQRR